MHKEADDRPPVWPSESIQRSETSKKAVRTQRAIELEPVKRQTSTPAYLAQIGILLLNGNVGPQSNNCGAERLWSSRWAIFHIQLHERVWYQSNVWMHGARLHHHRGKLGIMPECYTNDAKRHIFVHFLYSILCSACVNMAKNIPCNAFSLSIDVFGPYSW